MNKSLLIVICDFLVLSLLAIVRFDDAPATAQPQSPTNATTVARQDQDMLDVLALALKEEQQAKQQLAAQLAQTRQNLTGQQTTLSQREQNLQQIQQALQQAQQSLQQKEVEKQRTETERIALQEQFANTQASLESLKEQLNQTSSQSQLSRQRLLDLQSELARRQEQTAQLQSKLAEAEQTQRRAEIEKGQLAIQLQVAETEKRLAKSEVDTMRNEVQVVRAEKARLQEQSTTLAQGVTALAATSKELTQEIRENRPLAPNTIFSDFIANRVQSDFQAIRRGIFGREINREKESKTVLVTDGTNSFALFHVDDTPLVFSDPATDWDWLTGNLRRKSSVAPIEQIWFLQIDPRVAVVPVSAGYARLLGSKVYPIATDPFKFQEAVVVGASEGYYGECRFQLDPNLPQYLKMEHSTLKGLFGKFNPSTGDLVFSKSGELLGIMVNNEYCALLRDFTRLRAVRLGIDITQQRTGQTLTELRWRIDQLPLPLR